MYEPGFLVRANGDTLRGEIENDFWNVPPTFIRFRSVASSPSTLFLPRQLRAVSFTKGRYFRYEALPIDHAAETRLDNLPRGNVFTVHTDSLLAEVLIEGPTMLWRVAQPGALHLLVRRPDRPVLDLSERRYLRQLNNGSWAVTEGNNYRAQLGLYFGDCPPARDAAATADFTASGLAEVVRTYYEACAPSQPVARSWLNRTSPRHRQAFVGGVLAGMRYNHIESPATVLAGACSDCGIHPFGGFYAELLQASRTAAIYGELTLSGFRNQSVQYISATNSYRQFSYRALLGTARIGVRFFSPLAHDQHLVFSLGLEHNEVIAPQVTSGNPVVPPSTSDLLYASPTLLPNLGIGWRRQRLTLSLDAQLYHNTDGDDSIGGIFFGSDVATRVGVSYRLGRHPDERATR